MEEFGVDRPCIVCGHTWAEHDHYNGAPCELCDCAVFVFGIPGYDVHKYTEK